MDAESVATQRISPLCRRPMYTCMLMMASLVLLTGDTLAVEVVVHADAVVLNNPQAVGVEQALRGQFEPLLRVELSFANRVCKLSDDQRRKVIAKSNKWLTKFSKDHAKQGGQLMINGGWLGGRHQPVDARESVQKGVAEVIGEELPKEQAELYAEECKRRAEFTQKVAIDNLVARIDKELVLSPEQREKIAASLTEHRDKSWAPQPEMFMHGMNMWPNVPDQWIRPHLTATQQLAWSRIDKHSAHVFFGGMGDDGQVIDDIDLEEGQAKPAEADANVAAGAAPAAAIAVPQANN